MDQKQKDIWYSLTEEDDDILNDITDNEAYALSAFAQDKNIRHFTNLKKEENNVRNLIIIFYKQLIERFPNVSYYDIKIIIREFVQTAIGNHDLSVINIQGRKNKRI